MLWCIDPDTKNSGLSIFSDRLSTIWSLDWVGHLAPFTKLGYGPDRDHHRILVCEKPRIYPGVPGLDANDLVDLAEVVGWFRSELKPDQYFSYYPADWKAQVPKPIHHNRIWQTLTPFERALFPTNTEEKIQKGLLKGKYGNNQDPLWDLLDSAGIGLFHLKRTTRGAGKLT